MNKKDFLKKMKTVLSNIKGLEVYDAMRVLEVCEEYAKGSRTGNKYRKGPNIQS
jgi:glycerol-3-phosphate dehydrogenase